MREIGQDTAAEKGETVAATTKKAATKKKSVSRRGAAARRSKKTTRDVERDYPAAQFVAKLRRLADCIEQGKRFQIQIAGERVAIPSSATIQLEHERGTAEEEVEFQLKWSL
jgi:amphi-Trp domain-containing protein